MLAHMIPLSPSSTMQKLEVISGFQRLRYLDGLLITENPSLLAVDGLWGIDTVTSVVNIINNPELCYVLDSLSDKSFWQVMAVNHYFSVHISLYTCV